MFKTAIDPKNYAQQLIEEAEAEARNSLLRKRALLTGKRRTGINGSLGPLKFI